MLDQWWAPKPWVARTKWMDFTVGGRRFYAMMSPEGQEQWSIQEYISISPTSNFQFPSAFADQDEKIDESMPRSKWDLSFSEDNETTTVSIIIQLKSLAHLEQHIQRGFKEGFTKTLNYVEQLLKTLN